MVGIYGVIAYSVSQRTGEIGVRLALGAQAGQVVALVVRQGFVAALAGVAAGTLAAVYLSELLAGLLYGVTAQDPITFATVPALLLAVALIACWLPAARATRVRPASALRHE
jgi:putative ABC transport system permease protein